MNSKAALRVSIVLFIAFSAPLFRAAAAPIAISGTAGMTSAVEARFQLSGSGFTAQSSTIDWRSPVLVCAQNSTCDVTLQVPASLDFQGIFPDTSSGSLNAVPADVLGGGLTFTGSVFIPPATINTPVAFTVPVTLTGSISGYRLVDCGPGGCALPDLVWNVAVSGTGRLDLSGFGGPPQDAFVTAGYTFTGTATPTPEPSSWLLLGTGLAAFAWRRRKN